MNDAKETADSGQSEGDADHGKAWDINEDPEEKAEPNPDLHSRSGEGAPGTAWKINEDDDDED